MEEKVKIGKFEVNVVKKDIKNFHLSVLPPLGKVRVAVPNKTDNEAIKLFILSKSSWIKKQIKKFEEQQRESQREFISGESHYFKGQRYILNIKHHNAPPKIVIRNKTNIDFYIKKDLTREQREAAFYKWYRKELKTILPEIVTKWEARVGVKASEHKVKKMKTKWGTCNHKDKRIWLNIELIKKPLIHLEYVVLHELVHLIEKTHNEVFLFHMDNHMPQWRVHKDELNSLSLAYEEWNE